MSYRHPALICAKLLQRKTEVGTNSASFPKSTWPTGTCFADNHSIKSAYISLIMVVNIIRCVGTHDKHFNLLIHWHIFSLFGVKLQDQTYCFRCKPSGKACSEGLRTVCWCEVTAVVHEHSPNIAGFPYASWLKVTVRIFGHRLSCW